MYHLTNAKKVKFNDTLDVNHCAPRPFNPHEDSSRRCPYEGSLGIGENKPCVTNQSEEAETPTPNNVGGDLTETPPPSTRTAPRESPEKRTASKERASKIICPDNKASEEPTGNATSCAVHLDPNARFERQGRGVYNDVSEAQQMMDKLKEMVIEEDFRRENPVMRRQLFKYRGICGTLGNPVFNNTPVAPPLYEPRPPARTVRGYPRPNRQHPMYRTTSADIGGSEPYLESTPIFYYPNDQSFTVGRAIGGMYEDAHLTTELDKDAIW